MDEDCAAGESWVRLFGVGGGFVGVEGGSLSAAAVAAAVGERVFRVRVQRRDRVRGEHGEGESVAEGVAQGWRVWDTR